MSTLVCETITNGTDTITVANDVKGSAKAWVNFNGVTNTINKSFNISSFVDLGTGQYRFTFTTLMPDSNYVVSANPVISTSRVRQLGVGVNGKKEDTLTIQCVTVNLSTVGLIDSEICDIVIFGD